MPYFLQQAVSDMAIINNWEPKGLHMDYRGNNCGKDILKHVLDLSGDPRFDTIKYIIGDFTHSTQIDATGEDVKMLAAYNAALSKSNPDILNPTVLPIDDEHCQSLVALYVLITEELTWGTTWTSSLEEARTWITDRRNDGWVAAPNDRKSQ
jgi:hypothetical protein